MRVFIAIVFIVSSAGVGFAQDSTWKTMDIDQNLTVSFPAISSELDTLVEKKGKKVRFKYLIHETGESTLSIMSTPNETELNVRDGRSLKTALAGITKGMLMTLDQSGFDCLVSDTTLDDWPYKKLECRGEASQSTLTYVTLMYDKLYTFQLTSQTNSSTLPDIRRLMNSVHFNNTAVHKKKIELDPEGIGLLVGGLVMVALLIVIVRYIVRKNRPKGGK